MQATDILCMRPSSMGAADKLIWTPTKSGDYSTKSGYYSAVEMNRSLNPINPAHAFNWIKNVWATKTAPKIQVFLWKVMQGALPLGATLQRRGLLASSVVCTRCGEEETAAHLFLHCQFTRRVWETLPLSEPIDPSRFDSFSMAISSTPGMSCLPPSGVTIDLFPWLCWCLWTARNSRIFENVNLSAIEIGSKAVRLAREWQIAQPLKPEHRALQPISRRSATNNVDMVICHSDASWSSHTKAAGCGWWFSDTAGTKLGQGSSTEQHVSSPLMAEAIAVREALLHAKTLQFTKICLKSDNQVLINALSSKIHPVEIYGLNLDIEALSATFSFLHFSFIPRRLNSVADLIAKSATCNTYSVLPL